MIGGAMTFLKPDPLVEAEVEAIGGRLFRRMDAAPPPRPFSRKGIYQQLMQWAMEDPAFKTQLFRFVDVLPTLKSDREVARHLREYLPAKALAAHPWLEQGLMLGSLAPVLMAKAVKSQVLGMARQFVAAATPAEAAQHLHHNRSLGLATTFDLLGEAVVTEDEADAYLIRNLAVLKALHEEVTRHPLPAASDQGAVETPRVNVSIKISALVPMIDPTAPERTLPALKNRLRHLLQRAKELNAHLHFDMESYALKDLTLRLFREMLEESEFETHPHTGIVIQAYLKESESDLRTLLHWARFKGRRIGIRLVKGAYWDHEVITASQRQWPVPVWLQKAESDANFEKLTVFLLENSDIFLPRFATHNVRSVAHAIAQANRLGIDPKLYEFQTLFGMADDLKLALVQSGYRVREYAPVGNLLPGMAYLVRRLLENSSNEGFLSQRHRRDPALLLSNPLASLPPELPRPSPSRRVAFVNVPNTDFTHPRSHSGLHEALANLRSNLGRQHPLVINGRRVVTGRFEPSLNPAHPDMVLGHWAVAGERETEAAVQAAYRAKERWAATPVDERAAVIDRLAELIAARRAPLTALEILEVGKPWGEADADISEAIDFCHYYAAEMRRLGRPRLTQEVAGEENHLLPIPRGVGAVIAPWNFPLAILCGMTVAPLVAGNTLILKPAEQSSLVGAAFMELLEEAGVPPGVVNLLTGFGEEVGRYLVEHPKVDFITFTGSRSVGLSIWETAGKTVPGQLNLKKVVCEMGGKNAMIIDDTADLDEAIPAAITSTFAYAGQKCSALSRLIVLDSVYDHCVERFVGAMKTIPVGDPALPGTVVGPVIDAQAKEKIERAIENGRRHATLMAQGSLKDAPKQGYFVPPTVFTNVTPLSDLAQEEIFGPVVAVIRASNLDEAFAIANSTSYALTGGIFSRTPSSLERAKHELQVGNLYINRSITGAIVQRQPFGGYRMSGGGTKAGGPGYLEQFFVTRVVSENVVRRGFSAQSSPPTL